MAQRDSKKVAVGIGLATLAAAAAGAYFLYGTDQGKKKRKEIKGWALKMKGEVLDKMEKMESLSEDTYKNVVDSVARGYQSMKNIDAAEVAVLATELKNHWKNIRKHLAPKTKKRTTRKTKTTKRSE
jgi:hypothetical protein